MNILNDDILALTISYLDITEYSDDIPNLLNSFGTENYAKILLQWQKETLYETKIQKNKTSHKVNGKLHRVDGPAVEWSNGDKEWWVNDKLHRLDGPAIEWANGDKSWWVNGDIHRLDGPAVELISGTKMWFFKGHRQRVVGQYNQMGWL
jgi:hypothetical protein